MWTLSKALVPITAGDLILFSNANGNAIQTVTNVSGQALTFASGLAAGDTFALNGTAKPAGTIIQLQNSIVDPITNKRTYNGTYPPTTASRIWMISYYLDDTTDPGRVRLMRRTNFRPAVVVGETIEDLQLTYKLRERRDHPVESAGRPGEFLREPDSFRRSVPGRALG